MNIQRYIRIVALLAQILFLRQCVEPFHPELDGNNASGLLVVEGLISDQAGPFRVRLSSTLPVYDQRYGSSSFPPVSGALVQVSDDQGHLYTLHESEAGWYETEEQDLKGIPGNTYYLAIVAPDGRQYESTGVLMKESPPIDSVYFMERSLTYFLEERSYTETWLDILVDTRSTSGESTYYKWEFEETWEMDMPTYITVDHGTGEGAPPPSKESVDIEYEKKHCWVNDISRSILVRSNTDSPAEGIDGFVLQSIGPPDDRLNIRYSILVKQYVVDRQLYQYFRMIREANEESGGLYEKAPARIFGNIFCCESGDGAGHQALGFFMASTEQRYRIFIEADQHSVSSGSAYAECGWTTSQPLYVTYFPYGTYDNGSETVYSRNRYCTDCRARGTHIKPDFWDQGPHILKADLP